MKIVQFFYTLNNLEISFFNKNFINFLLHIIIDVISSLYGFFSS